MPKFFVASDIHGYYLEFIESLHKAGFDKENEDHWVVICGDYFDRGQESVKLMNFLLNLPRKILVRGNHENLMMECLNRGYPLHYDKSNGTWDTVLQFAYEKRIKPSDAPICAIAATKLVPFIEQTINYFETKNHIFVHGWIPVIANDGLPDYFQRDRVFTFNPSWREAHQKEWDSAMWRNGMEMWERGLAIDKTICCGHWHSSYGHSHRDGTSEFGPDANFTAFCDTGIIALDACTAHTKEVNVVVLEDEFLEEP